MYRSQPCTSLLNSEVDWGRDWRLIRGCTVAGTESNSDRMSTWFSTLNYWYGLPRRVYNLYLDLPQSCRVYAQNIDDSAECYSRNTVGPPQIFILKKYAPTFGSLDSQVRIPTMTTPFYLAVFNIYFNFIYFKFAHVIIMTSSIMLQVIWLFQTSE